MGQWIRHFDTFLNTEEEHANSLRGMEYADDVEPPDLEEVIDVVQKIINNKAPGVDNLSI